MNPSEVPQLLAQIALADPRVRRTDHIELRAQIHMWAGILADVPYDAAIRYAQQHYERATYPILPADIATRWHADVRDRLTRHTGTFEPLKHPQLDPDDEAGYRRALAAERHAVATGMQQPDTTRAITAGPAAAEVTRRLEQLGAYMPQHVRDALTPRTSEQPPSPTWRAVPCPYCRAEPRRPCTTATGRRLTHPHPSRIDTAAQPAA
ncbi:hypothetical protein [Streptomyces sp. CC228A]|uniref:zinc finger domain-containing protein n=1 Tax=Streptomyces sp. CC228A TaxID=2898186 RepID=UPI001F3264DF|nr:hypothetical protein [Streptomyces sp. CC228A]